MKSPTKYNLTMYVQAILCRSLTYVLLKKTTFLISSGYCRSINQPHHLPHHNQLQAVCRCQCVPHSNVEKVGISMQNYKRYTITMQILQTELYVHFMHV